MKSSFIHTHVMEQKSVLNASVTGTLTPKDGKDPEVGWRNFRAYLIQTLLFTLKLGNRVEIPLQKSNAFVIMPRCIGCVFLFNQHNGPIVNKNHQLFTR